MNYSDTQKKIIRNLFVRPKLSRSSLADILHLSNAGLTLAIKPLLEEGLIKEIGKMDTSRLGRKELTLVLDPKYGFFFGIDVKKHHLYYYLMDFMGEEVLSGSEVKIKDVLSVLAPYEKKLLAIGVNVRGKADEESIKERFPELYQEMSKCPVPVYWADNVDTLGDIHALYHPEDRTFLLVKYGPGVGSSVYIDGKNLGSRSELGHTYYQDKTLEDTISYHALLHQDFEEKEATKMLFSLPYLKDCVIHTLAFALVNADSLLSLQKIILSGEFLSMEENRKKLAEEMASLNPSFDSSKLMVYPSYQEISVREGALRGFISYFH